MTTVAQPVLSAAAIFRSCGYIPHKAQRAVHKSQARNRVVDAGRRFGKSEIGAGELDIEAVRTHALLPKLRDTGKRREFWIVGPEYTDSEKEFRKHYDALRRLDAPFDKPGTYYDAHSGDMQLSMYGGKYLVIGKSAKHPERLVGEGLSGVIMAEAAKQKERTWIKYIRPTLADERGWSLHTSTPEGKNWFYNLWKRGQDPNDVAWESWRMPSWLNPYVYPMGASPSGMQMLREAINSGRAITQTLRKNSGVDSEIIEFMLDLTEEAFNQEIAADFTEFVGRVFKGFDEEEHVGDFPFMSSWRTYAACDYGFTDPFVWLLIQEDLDGNIYVLDEIYETGLSIDDAARLISARGLAPAGLIEFMPDPASPSDTLALERHLRIRANRNTGGERNIRLRYIRESLKHVNTHLDIDDPLRHPRLRIDRKCVNLIREMQDYRYPDKRPDLHGETRKKDEPMHANSHSPEALGRYFRGRFGDPGSSPGGGSVVRRSNLSR